MIDKLNDWHYLLYSLVPKSGRIAFEDLRAKLKDTMENITPSVNHFHRAMRSLESADLVLIDPEVVSLAGVSTTVVFYSRTRRRVPVSETSELVRKVRSSVREFFYRPSDYS